MLLNVSFAWENLDGELLKAAEEGDTDRVEEMLDKGAVIECRNNYGVSALIWVANNNHLETLKLLVSRKADKEAKSNDGRTAFVWACLWGHLDIIHYLLEEGVDIDNRDRRGMSALMHAVAKGHEEVVRILLDSGADPHVENVYKGTALSIAKLGDNKNIMRMIEEKVRAKEKELYASISDAVGDKIEEWLNYLLTQLHEPITVVLRLLGKDSSIANENYEL